MIARRDPARWLSLVAAPTFAAMALFTSLSGADLLCTATGEAGPLGGMTLMYLLMSAFHCPPWLRLLAALRS